MFINKKKLSVATIASFILFSGCSIKNETFQNNLKIQKKVSQYHETKMKPIEVIKIPSYVNKYKNINHNLGKKDVYVTFHKNKSFLLGELTSINGIPVIVDPLINSKTVFIKNFKGKISKLLDMIASLTNSYWTYDRGVIKFQKTAEVVYTFPALSLEKIAEVYNVGESADNKINMDLKDSIFEEMKSIIKDLADAYNISATIDYSNKHQQELSNINSNNLQKTTKNNSLETKNFYNENSKEKASKNIEESSYKLKTGSNLNNSVNSVLNQFIGNNVRKSLLKKKEKMREEILKNLPISSSLAKVSNFNNLVNDNSLNKTSNKKNKQLAKELNKNKSININTNKKNDILRVTSFNVKESFNTPKERIILSPNSGTVIAFVTPNEEKKLDLILTTLMKKRFSSMIRLRTIALLTTESKVRQFQNQMYSVLNDSASSGSSIGTSIAVGTGGTNIATGATLTGLSLTIGKGLTFGAPDSFTALVDYFTSNNSGSILLNPSLVLLPNVIGRIQDSTNIPFLEPEQITNNQDNTLTYKVNYVKEGVNMAYIASVFNDNLILSLKFSITQYLGDKTIKAGVMGEYSLPMYAPKTIQTTYRIRPGDVIVLGGLAQSKSNFEKSTHFKIPSQLSNTKDKLEFVLITQPQLIKFQVDKNIKTYNPYKEIDIDKNQTENKKVQINTKALFVISSKDTKKKNDKLDIKIEKFIKSKENKNIKNN